jgi:hypothetical protein
MIVEYIIKFVGYCILWGLIFYKRRDGLSFLEIVIMSLIMGVGCALISTDLRTY